MAIGIARGLDLVCDCAHARKHVVSSDALRRLLGAGSGNSRTFDFSFDRQMMCARIVLRRRRRNLCFLPVPVLRTEVIEVEKQIEYTD